MKALGEGHVLLIRADASAEIGSGHVMRCLALAQAWQRGGGQVVFLTASITSGLRRRLQSERMAAEAISAAIGSVEDAEATLAEIVRLRPVWIAVDGYQFDAGWEQVIKKGSARLLVLDDYGHADHAGADLLVNQNISARTGLYPCVRAKSRLLLGTRYSLLRREFSGWRNRRPVLNSGTNRILVTFGGGDPANLAGRTIAALKDLPEIEVIAVIGGSNPHRRAVEQQIAETKRFEAVVDATNMPELMAWADVAIAAAGSTSWELAFMRVPSVLIIAADNQSAIAPALAASGASVNLGSHEHIDWRVLPEIISTLLADPVRRLEMAKRAGELVDGRGAERVVTRMKASLIELAPASAEDCHQLWTWANDPSVRQSAFNSTPIPWESHQQWFATKLKSARSRIYIGSAPGRLRFGQVRFDCNDNGIAEVDVSVAPESRGAGWGSALISRAALEAIQSRLARRVEAHIKVENTASIRAFEGAGFIRQGEAVRHGRLIEILTFEGGDE